MGSERDGAWLGRQPGAPARAAVATWYAYGADDAPLWLSALSTEHVQRLTGPLVRTFGPHFDDTGRRTRPPHSNSTATVTFVDGNHATFGYATNGNGGLPAASQAWRSRVSSLPHQRALCANDGRQHFTPSPLNKVRTTSTRPPTRPFLIAHTGIPRPEVVNVRNRRHAFDKLINNPAKADGLAWSTTSESCQAIWLRYRPFASRYR